MKTLLDTNVLSELLRSKPEPAVLAWFARQHEADLAVCSVTQAEMLFGVQLLPAGKRRQQLDAALAAMFEADFAGRLWPFDAAAAHWYARIAAERRKAGKPIAQLDAQIAAVARARGAAVATRDTAGFVGCGIVLRDPWSEAG